MSVRIAPLLTTIATADTATPGDGTWAGGGSVSTDDSFVEGASSLGVKVTAATLLQVFTKTTPVDLTGQYVYVWLNCASILAPQAQGGVRVRVGTDATNFREYWVGGSDTYAGGWKCFCVDPSRNGTINSGTVNLASITVFGGGFNVVSSIMGTFHNVLIDAIRVGTGLQITSGSTADPATLAQIASSSATTQTAYGVISAVPGGFSLQGELVLGSSGSTTSGSLVFADQNTSIVFPKLTHWFSPTASFATESVTDQNYRLSVLSSNAESASVTFGSRIGTGSTALGVNPVNISAETASVRFKLECQSPSMRALRIYGSTLSNARQVVLGSGSYSGSQTGGRLNSSSLEVVGVSFLGPTQIIHNVSSGSQEWSNVVSSPTQTTGSFAIADSEGFLGDKYTLVQGYGLSSFFTGSTTHSLIRYAPRVPFLDVFIDAKNRWDFTDPTWGSTGAPIVSWSALGADSIDRVTEQYSFNYTVQKSDATALSASLLILYDTGSNTIPNRNSTDASGLTTGNILKRLFQASAAGTSSVATTKGPFLLRAWKYGQTPFETLQGVTEPINTVISLPTDTGITLTEPQADFYTGSVRLLYHKQLVANEPSTGLPYISGAASFVSGNVVVGRTSGASGSVQETGQSANGLLFLRGRNHISFSHGEILDVAGVGTASASIPVDPELRYSWEIDGNNEDLANVYMVMSSQMAKVTASATFVTAEQWGTQPIIRSGDNYSTVRNATKREGVFISKRGAGTVTTLTSDSSGTFTPPQQFFFKLTGLVSGSEVRVYELSSGTELAGVEDVGVTGIFTYNYTYTGVNVDVFVVMHAIDYVYQSLNTTLSNANTTIPITQQFDRNYSNPA